MDASLVARLSGDPELVEELGYVRQRRTVVTGYTLHRRGIRPVRGHPLVQPLLVGGYPLVLVEDASRGMVSELERLHNRLLDLLLPLRVVGGLYDAVVSDRLELVGAGHLLAGCVEQAFTRPVLLCLEVVVGRAR